MQLGCSLPKNQSGDPTVFMRRHSIDGEDILTNMSGKRVSSYCKFAETAYCVHRLRKLVLKSNNLQMHDMLANLHIFRLCSEYMGIQDQTSKSFWSFVSLTLEVGLHDRIDWKISVSSPCRVAVANDCSLFLSWVEFETIHKSPLYMWQ